MSNVSITDVRSSGILAPLFSLPSRHGIGTLGHPAHEFTDFLALSGQRYWQMLPIGPTGYGDSPYQSFSSFAGNPYFIDPDTLAQKGLLLPDEFMNIDYGGDTRHVDYKRLWETRLPLLTRAYARFCDRGALDSYIEQNASWLCDYALFMALKEHFDFAPWYKWPDGFKLRDGSALDRARDELCGRIDFYCWLQYEFDCQWQSLHEYAAQKGVLLIGDLPIYVAEDSADAWQSPQSFLMDKNAEPTVVAGCPPDYFSPTGQLWGNPIYDWHKMSTDGFGWWIDRLESVLCRFDALRFDHFRGLCEYWAVPYGDDTAEHGEWQKGPGIDFIEAVRQKLPNALIIAEDLGFLTPDVQKLLCDSGWPGMKVLSFAFDSDDSAYLPHNHIRNCVAYTGTHDNTTIGGWLAAASAEQLLRAKSYLGLNEAEGLANGMLRGVLCGAAGLCIVQISEYIGLGDEARINTPGTAQGNWRFRILPGELTDSLAQRISALARRYGRHT